MYLFVFSESNVSHGRRRKKEISEFDGADTGLNNESSSSVVASTSQSDGGPPPEQKRINVTGLNLTITGLRHFSEYQVMVSALIGV